MEVPAPPQIDAPQPPPAPRVSYSSCKEAKAAGAAPLHRGDPGYSRGLDRDGDGVACET
ncbi:excalibur calcium-binding domain-containing protein [Nocardia jiangsuensis]|uniref:Excalibur calcium-binding domain-containing protein n=1 Tax=Nocardia jiangsuensis TaxID=1691563 RepID=A0ABV8DTE7_9NOCA